MSKDKEQLSLFEHLGRAAGPDLGKEVMEAALNHKDYVEVSEKSVSTPYYEGVVKTYPKSFLVEYFAKEEKSSFREKVTVDTKIEYLVNHLETLEKRILRLENEGHHEADELPF
tara:strand:- start:587 stop:928 length:342 start_codon:yes stop_codon:yes gene_type:complete